MKLAIIFPVLNQFELTQVAINQAINNLSGKNDVELLVIDNGSDGYFNPTVTNTFKKENLKFIESAQNIGVYPIFWEALKHTNADILAFFHTDLIVSEKGWDDRVIKLFEEKNNLGLVGFIGSNQIDSAGGRGLGTTSNFLGDIYVRDVIQDGDVMRTWNGSKASVHGKVNDGFSQAAVVDGCAMIFRRVLLEAIKQRDGFPPHHFYDRMLSCEVREHGYEMGVLGIGCDHISGQSVNGSAAYEQMAQTWALMHGLTNHALPNWDSVLYREAERQWLEEYRDIKKLVPIIL